MDTESNAPGADALAPANNGVDVIGQEEKYNPRMGKAREASETRSGKDRMRYPSADALAPVQARKDTVMDLASKGQVPAHAGRENH